jgi:hypothetical protein
MVKRFSRSVYTDLEKNGLPFGKPENKRSAGNSVLIMLFIEVE